MATVYVTFSIEDGEGERHSVPIYLPDGTTQADAQSFVTAFAPLLRDVITGKVAKAEVNLGLTLPFVGGTPPQGTRVDAGATLSFLDSVNKAYSLYVPTFDMNKIVNKMVVATDTDVAAFIDAVVTGVGGVAPVDAYELAINAYRRGFQSKRK